MCFEICLDVLRDVLRCVLALLLETVQKCLWVKRHRGCTGSNYSDIPNYVHILANLRTTTDNFTGMISYFVGCGTVKNRRKLNYERFQPLNGTHEVASPKFTSRFMCSWSHDARFGLRHPVSSRSISFGVKWGQNPNIDTTFTSN